MDGIGSHAEKAAHQHDQQMRKARTISAVMEAAEGKHSSSVLDASGDDDRSTAPSLCPRAPPSLLWLTPLPFRAGRSRARGLR